MNGGPLAADESTTQRVAMLASRSADTDPAIHSRVLDTYGKMPLSFELNQGQSDPRVKFLSRGARYEVFLNPTEALLGLREPEKYQDPKSALAKIPQKPALPEFATLAMRLNGANPAAQVEGQGALELKSNYLIGNDRSKWHTGIANYRSVRFSSIYSGIDLVYHGSDQGRLEYDFVVAPGADPSKIEISFEGAKGLKLKANGDLGIKIAGGEVIEHAPLIYQHSGNKRETISGGYVLRGKNRVSFELASYDRSREVIIDPVIVYSTFLGGSGQERGYGVAADSAGVAYVTGQTCSMNFPVTNHALQGSTKGS